MNESGEVGIVRGTGATSQADPGVLEAELHIECFTTGRALDFQVTWTYDPGIDTIDGGGLVWHRSGAH